MLDDRPWTTMFWLFRRKKVADKRPALAPCVCENGPPVQGFRLREFASTIDRCLTPRSTSDGALSRMTFSEGSRSTKRGYHKLQGETVAEEQPRLPASEPESTSSQSSTDCSDYDPELGETSASDDEEALTCNVCDRTYRSLRLLEQHQQRKRHYGCSTCDSIFPNLMALEHHKETLDHWSEDEGHVRDSDTDDESIEENPRLCEEMERLL